MEKVIPRLLGKHGAALLKEVARSWPQYKAFVGSIYKFFEYLGRHYVPCVTASPKIMHTTCHRAHLSTVFVQHLDRLQWGYSPPSSAYRKILSCWLVSLCLGLIRGAAPTPDQSVQVWQSRTQWPFEQLPTQFLRQHFLSMVSRHPQKLCTWHMEGTSITCWCPKTLLRKTG